MIYLQENLAEKEENLRHDEGTGEGNRSRGIRQVPGAAQGPGVQGINTDFRHQMVLWVAKVFTKENIRISKKTTFFVIALPPATYSTINHQPTQR